MYPLTRLRFRWRFWNLSGGPVEGALLMEDGSFLLQEDSSYIMLE